jgi:hypothetical protein
VSTGECLRPSQPECHVDGNLMHHIYFNYVFFGVILSRVKHRTDALVRHVLQSLTKSWLTRRNCERTCTAQVSEEGASVDLDRLIDMGPAVGVLSKRK